MSAWTHKKLYLLPRQGMVKGVCAGLADYLGVPVKLVRLLAVVALFFGLFVFTLMAYAILAYWLEPAPEGRGQQGFSQLSASRQLDMSELQLVQNEQQLRLVERYVTSETFGVRNRFRQL